MLVGGIGTRLRPLTFTIPKQMLPVVDVPMLERKIAHLVDHGIDDIVLSMGYRPDAFREAYPDNRCSGARLQYVVESEPLGTAGAIAFAARHAGITGTFLAFNGDVLTDLRIHDLLAMHNGSGAEGTVSLTPVADPSRFGVVPTDDQGRVQAFIEKPSPGEAPTNLINAGSYVLEPSFLDRVTPHVQVSIEREIFPQMVEESTLYAGAFDDYWLDIGTPESYLQANLDLLDAEFDGQSFIAGTAQVGMADCRRSVIGRECTVSDSATVIDSVLLPGASVDDGAVVERSVVGEHSRVGSKASLRNLTVVGGNCNVGNGAVLDGERVNPENVSA